VREVGRVAWQRLEDRTSRPAIGHGLHEQATDDARGIRHDVHARGRLDRGQHSR